MLQPANGIQEIILTSEMVQRVIFRRNDAIGFIFIEPEDPARTQTDCKYRPPDDRRDDPFEPTPVNRKFRLKNRMLVVQHCAPPRSNGTERARSLSSRNLSDLH